MSGGKPARAEAGWTVAAVAAFAAYLLTPTSLRLLLDGVPLNTRAELVGFLVLAVVLGAAATAWVLRLRAVLAPAARGGRRWLRLAPLVGVTVLLAGLSALKLAFPRDAALPVCFQSPEIAAPGCLWSPEGRGNLGVTRYENRLWFDAAAGRAWRLGYLNTSAVFNLYGHLPPDTPEGRRQRFRGEQANPFEARVTLPPHVARQLARGLADGAGLVWFSGRTRGALTVTSADGVERYASASGLTALQRFRFAVPEVALTGLTLLYRNYDCPDGPPASCVEGMTFRTVSQADAVLDVRVVRPGAPGTVPLGYGHLLLAGRAPAALAARGLETVALILLAWGAVVVPVGTTLALRVRTAARALSAWEAVVAPGVALAVATLAYVGAAGGPVWGQEYATLFDAGVSFWLTLPGTAALLLVAMRPRWRDRLGTAAALPSRWGFVLWLLPFIGYAVIQVVQGAPATDEATLWPPGDDNLTWASRSKDVLRQQTLAWAFASIAKSAFPYLRALGYLVLGEGERFTSIAVGVAFLAVYGIVAYSLYQACVATAARGTVAVRSVTVVLYAVLLGWLAQALLAYGADHAAKLFTEGPAWVAFTLSAALLLRAVTASLDGRLVAAVGATFAAAVLGRSTLLVMAPVFFMAPLAFTPGGQRTLGMVLRGILLPLPASLGLVLAHATVVGAWSHVGWYLAVNTSIRPGMSIGSLFGEPLHRLVPTRTAALQLAVTGVLYVWVLWREGRAAGRWTAGPVLRQLGFGVVLILCGFLLQVPMLPAPYYPRTIMPTYFFLLIFLPAWLDRWSRSTLAAGRSPE